MSPATHDATIVDESDEKPSEAPSPPGNAWGDRLRALKNVPPVLHFVWESGPAVVFWNIAIRVVVAFLPVGIGIIGRFIIDGVNRIRLHLSLPPHFWWLVGAEMAERERAYITPTAYGSAGKVREGDDRSAAVVDGVSSNHQHVPGSYAR